jgi:hypothetical protein
MPNFEALLTMFFSPDNIMSVVLRALIWMIIAVVIIVSTDKPDPEKGFKDLKANLGFFMMFLFLSGGLVFLLFGFTSA